MLGFWRAGRRSAGFLLLGVLAVVALSACDAPAQTTPVPGQTETSAATQAPTLLPTPTEPLAATPTPTLAGTPTPYTAAHSDGALGRHANSNLGQHCDAYAVARFGRRDQGSAEMESRHRVGRRLHALQQLGLAVPHRRSNRPHQKRWRRGCRKFHCSTEQRRHRNGGRSESRSICNRGGLHECPQ